MTREVIKIYDDKLIIEMRNQGKTWDEIGERFGVDGERIRSYSRKKDWYDSIVQRNPHDKSQSSDKKVYHSDGSITSRIISRRAEKVIFKPPDLLRIHGFDPDEFEIKQVVSNEWSMTNSEGEQYYNFQSKIIAIPISGISDEEFIKSLKEDIQPLIIEPIGIGDRNLVIGLADLHFGVMTYEDYEPYLAELIEYVRGGYKIVVIEQLGDLFHSSQFKASQTLKGTILQDVDMITAWKDAKKFYYTLVHECLLNASKVAIEHACGNHSGNLEIAFLDIVRTKFEGTEHFEVNIHNDYRTAYWLDNVAIMISHGDAVPLKRLPSVFSVEYPLMWGQAEHREVHSGHKHTKELNIDGVTLRQFPTAKQTDDYEAKHGYNSHKMIWAIEYDEDKSKVAYDIW